MTDENERPGAGPSRESGPGVPEERAADATTEEESAGETVEAVVESETTVNVPEGATVETIDDQDEPASPDAVETVAADVETVTDEAVAGTEETVEAAVAPTTEPEGETVSETVAEVTDAAVVEKSGDAEPEEAPSSEAAAVDGDDETVTEPVVEEAIGDQRSDTFVWHPDHKGKTYDEVRAALAQDIAADQRQHRLAMDGAEESEQEALASVVTLERKWGPYDFDWAEQDPEALADRILDFERERERRQQMMSWSDYRNAEVVVDEAHGAGERPAELSTSAKGLSLLLVVLLIVVILLAVWAL